ncbi:MAG: PTS mannitol transporter subunit IICB [Romboutsia sp.]
MSNSTNKKSSEESKIKTSVQKFGKFLSGMVMPNIGAFIAWGLITACFIGTGWFPNEKLSTMVDPMLKYLLPTLIAYTGGKAIAGQRGGVIGSIAAMGVIIGADIPMFIGAMAMGPFAGWIIKKFDKWADGKIPTGFEMLVNNFSIGIIGMLLAIVGFYAVGPAIVTMTVLLESGVQIIVQKGLLPLVSIFIEPGKVLFLNNAINHGILGPIGISEAKEAGQSIMFLLESNPGPGLGIILAYWMFSKGAIKQSAPGAAIIHFFGGIHEIYFPYVLMNPVLIIAAIAGGAAGVLVFSILGAGLVAAPSPGSIFALMAMAPKGGLLPVLAGVVAATGVSFLVAAPFVKKAAKNENEDSLEEAKNKVKDMKSTTSKSGDTKIVDAKDIKKIIFACDAGMGSSAMGASRFKNRIKDLNLDIEITNTSVDNIPVDTQIVVTHDTLVDRVAKSSFNIEIIAINNFLKDPNLDGLFERLSK